jgi:hypothetical protein
VCMPNIVENWTSISGKVLSIQRHSALDVLSLEILKKKGYKDFPDLISTETHQLEVRLTEEKVRELKLEQGSVIEGLVRAAGPDLYFFNPESVSTKF